MHAEASAARRWRRLVDRRIILKQRVGADDKIDVAGGETRSGLSSLTATSRGENGEPDAGNSGKPRNGGMMLARGISIGAINAACRPASIMVATAINATTVLPEPTSPCSSRNMLRLRQVGDDVGHGALLRRRQRMGSAAMMRARSHPRRRCPSARCAYGRNNASATARQKFVVSEPRPRPRLPA